MSLGVAVNLQLLIGFTALFNMWTPSLPTINPFIGTFVLTFTIFFLIWQLWNKKSPNSPPGTKGWPLLGVLPLLTMFPERVMQKWGKKYGPLYMVKIGTVDVVVISSPEIAYEAFAKNDCFNDRPQTISSLDDDGIVLVNFIDKHKEQRRFGLNALRDFGMGRRSLEPRLIEISEEFCRKIDALCGETGTSDPFEIHTYIYKSISSVISCIIFGYDVDAESKDFRALIDELTKPKPTNALGGLLVFAPFLRFFPFFSGVWKGGIEYREKMHKEITKDVLEHQQSRDPNNPRDFIDCFLNEMDKADNSTFEEQEDHLQENDVQREQSENELKGENPDFSRDWKPLSSFTIKQLVGFIRDLFLAGTDTTSTTVWWLILYLCKYPDVQKKMQQEIDDVLGQSGVPRMSIMEKLPYVRAVIQEVTRIRPVVPLSVPHMASRDASLLGYRIPKGAIILTNIWAIHHDETRWPEPDKFSPERHLDEDGKFIKSPNWMSFSLGGRACVGQQLAKMELFFATVTLFRRFHFSLAPGETPDLKGESKMTLHPWHFKMIAKRY